MHASANTIGVAMTFPMHARLARQKANLKQRRGSHAKKRGPAQRDWAAQAVIENRAPAEARADQRDIPANSIIIGGVIVRDCVSCSTNCVPHRCAEPLRRTVAPQEAIAMLSFLEATSMQRLRPHI